MYDWCLHIDEHHQLVIVTHLKVTWAFSFIQDVCVKLVAIWSTQEVSHIQD